MNCLGFYFFLLVYSIQWILSYSVFSYIPLEKSSSSMDQTSFVRHLKEDNIQLHNYLGTLYYGPVTIASNVYNLQIDTGSSDLWVSCYYYKEAECSSSCPRGSSTIRYGSGTVCVKTLSNTVAIGGITLPNYYYGVAYGRNVVPSSDNSVVLGGAHGILGLAYPELASIFKSESKIINAIQNFSMYLTPREGEQGSLLILNGIYEEYVRDNRMMGFTVQLKSKKHWTIDMSQFSVDNDTTISQCGIGVDTCDAIVDSGTSFLTAPRRAFETFASTYLKPNGCTLAEQGFYICSRKTKLPVLSFKLGHGSNIKEFKLQPWDYSRVYSPDQIVVQLQQSPKGSVADSWILGDTFLKVYYTLYVVGKSVTFYCKDGLCDGGDDLLEFPGDGLASWQLVVIVIAVCAIATAIGMCIHFYMQSTRTRLRRPRMQSFHSAGSTP